jgi:hypothetical protein
VCTLHGLSAALTLTSAKADERETPPGMLEVVPLLAADRPGQTLTDRRRQRSGPRRRGLCLRQPVVERRR